MMIYPIGWCCSISELSPCLTNKDPQDQNLSYRSVSCHDASHGNRWSAVVATSDMATPHHWQQLTVDPVLPEFHQPSLANTSDKLVDKAG